MNVKDFKLLLNSNADSTIQIVLPDGSIVPDHFHVTEVARVQKDFIDCGGTKRSMISCQLQTWVADDINHRLASLKLAKILELAAPILQSEELPIEIEYENKLISQYPLIKSEIKASKLYLYLGTKHTDCLAKDKCRIEEPSSCCSSGNCC